MGEIVAGLIGLALGVFLERRYQVWDKVKALVGK